MRLDIYSTQHIVTMESPAEIILSRRIVAAECGEADPLTRKLSALICEAVRNNGKMAVSFNGDETYFILGALHNLAIGRSDSWEQAQAAYMLQAVT